MTIHKEGYRTIAYSTLIFGILNIGSFIFLSPSMPTIAGIIFCISLFLLFFIISFFRVPKRKLNINSQLLITPADGKIVVIEEIYDEEYFKDRRLQISVFMSPLNVHLNRYPIDGKVVYNQYHKGKYLVAWHPKSSTDNERHSIVIADKNGKEILVKQIAGALAKRIVNYSHINEDVHQNEEMGFIKFGSRVDILLPLNSKILVSLNQSVKCGITPIAEWI